MGNKSRFIIGVSKHSVTLPSPPFSSIFRLHADIKSTVPNITPSSEYSGSGQVEEKKTPPTDVQLKKRAPPPPPPPFLFKVSEEHYQAGPSRAETFPNPNLPADPSLAFNNCRHSLALLCDHAWMKSVKQLPELLGCLRLTFPQSKIYDLRARICHGNGSNLPPWEKV